MCMNFGQLPCSSLVTCSSLVIVPSDKFPSPGKSVVHATANASAEGQRLGLHSSHVGHLAWADFAQQCATDSLEGVPDLSSPWCFAVGICKTDGGHLLCAIKKIDVVPQDCAGADLPQKDVPKHVFVRWFGHTGDGSVPAVDEALQIRHGVAYLHTLRRPSTL